MVQDQKQDQEIDRTEILYATDIHTANWTLQKKQEKLHAKFLKLSLLY